MPQRFSKKIFSHLTSRNEKGGERSFDDLIPELEETKIKMLHTTMVFGVFETVMAD